MNPYQINARKDGPKKLDPSVLFIIEKIIGEQPMNRQMADNKMVQLQSLFPSVRFNVMENNNMAA